MCARNAIIVIALIVGAILYNWVTDGARAAASAIGTATGIALEVLTWVGLGLISAVGLVVLTVGARYIQRRQQARGACLTCARKCQAAASTEPVPVQISARPMAIEAPRKVSAEPDWARRVAQEAMRHE